MLPIKSLGLIVTFFLYISSAHAVGRRGKLPLYIRHMGTSYEMNEQNNSFTLASFFAEAKVENDLHRIYWRWSDLLDLADVSGSFESGYSYEVFCKAEELPIFRFTAAPRPMYVEENPWLLSKDRDAREAGRAEYYNKEIVPNLIANGDFKLNFRVQHFRTGARFQGSLHLSDVPWQMKYANLHEEVYIHLPEWMGPLWVDLTTVPPDEPQETIEN